MWSYCQPKRELPANESPPCQATVPADRHACFIEESIRTRPSASINLANYEIAYDNRGSLTNLNLYFDIIRVTNSAIKLTPASVFSGSQTRPRVSSGLISCAPPRFPCLTFKPPVQIQFCILSSSVRRRRSACKPIRMSTRRKAIPKRRFTQNSVSEKHEDPSTRSLARFIHLLEYGGLSNSPHNLNDGLYGPLPLGALLVIHSFE